MDAATPECLNPWDVVRYCLAGELIVTGLAKALCTSDLRISEVLFSKCNVDYAFGSDATWGCHESYLHRGDPSVFPEQIMPHLVSRIIYTGAGGWDSLSSGLEFLISPRVVHLVRTVSEQSTHDRGIFHTKDESLSKEGYHRLHLICGESLCSESAAWLKMGATALVIAMIEAGLNPGQGVALASPLKAMNVFARDPCCKAAVACTGGKFVTAIQIQRHFLELAEAHLNHDFMPSWAEAVCGRWRETLDRLHTGEAASMERCLDWPLKLVLFRDRVRRAGFSWDDIPVWNTVLKEIRDTLEMLDLHKELLPTDTEMILGEGSPVAERVKALTPLLKGNGLSWDGLQPFLNLRYELFELDLRYGQLGDQSIFAELDRKGCLRHHVDGVDNIENSLTEPPAAGRARLRSRTVTRLANRSPEVVCDWSRIYDRRAGRMMDLSDPFEQEEQWRDMLKLQEQTSEGIMDLNEVEQRLRARLRSRARTVEQESDIPF